MAKGMIWQRTLVDSYTSVRFVQGVRGDVRIVWWFRPLLLCLHTAIRHQRDRLRKRHCKSVCENRRIDGASSETPINGGDR